ncbi:MAG: hypothetical protein IJD88_03335, partial [Clostridia bacterium]|nr:hypothetical protein [Clostridia bacterium]
TNRDHYAPYYEDILNFGVSGLIDKIDKSLENHKGDAEKCETLECMKITLLAFRQMIKNYADKAKELENSQEYDKNRLSFIIKNCESLLKSPPQTFAEGLQLIWMCHNAFYIEGRRAMALGRLDQYLYKLYKKDRALGVTDEEITELLENVFTKIDTTDVVNICIGGMDENGNCQINGLSYCILNAVRNCNAPGPNLSARITPDTPDEFLLEALKSIGTGLGYPALMNDEINIPALLRHGYDKKDVYNYCMVGCIENFITGMQPPWSDGRFDAPRYFDYIFNNGKSEVSGTEGIDFGNVENIKSMDEFMRIFEKELEFGVAEYCFNFNAQNDMINQKHFSEPFLSCFCYDCIGRGLDINNGGSKYPSVHGAALMGVGTTADSLAAIEKVVFVDKEATLTDIKNAINSNFEGYEDLHKKLLSAPKYGNNDDFVDKYAVWYLDFLSDCFSHYRTRDGGAIYIAMAANVNNIYAGKRISATPDGRKKGEPLSDAASPTYGRDIKGATSTINSVTKPDYTKVSCGTVINQKFFPTMFEGEKLYKLLALVKTYFKKGGQELQINATSREILIDAMEYPEKYPTLVVRVSGYSDYYVRLSKEVQLDILNRTQHG